MEGEFGTFSYDNKVFGCYRLSFKSPSEHTVSFFEKFNIL